MTKKPTFSHIPTPVIKKGRDYLDSLLKEREQFEAENKVVKPEQESSYRVKHTIYQDCVSMTEIIDWAKNNVPQVNEVSLTAIKEKSSKQGYSIVIYLVYTVANQPLLDNRVESLAIYCNHLSDDLYNTFGGQDIIVFE